MKIAVYESIAAGCIWAKWATVYISSVARAQPMTMVMREKEKWDLTCSNIFNPRAILANWYSSCNSIDYCPKSKRTFHSAIIGTFHFCYSLINLSTWLYLTIFVLWEEKMTKKLNFRKLARSSKRIIYESFNMMMLFGYLLWNCYWYPDIL